MVKEFRHGKMAASTLVTGTTTKPTVSENYIMLMAMSMKVIGLMIKLKAKELTCIPMEHPTKETGLMISNTDMEKKHGLMGQFMKDTIKKARSMVKENCTLLMNLIMKVNLIPMKFKDMASTNGQTAKST